MKKLVLVLITLFITVTLSACSDLCIGESCISETEVIVEDEDEVEDEEIVALENVLYYDHIDGFGLLDLDHEAYILFEEELQGYVKYQVAYLSCTCRNSNVNYWQVIYVEVNKYTDDVRVISFGYDDPSAEHPYLAGMWGDSSPTPDSTIEGGGTKPGKTTEDFTTMYIPWLLNKTIEDFEGISVFTNKVGVGEVYEGLNTVTINDAFYTDPDTQEEIDLIDSFSGASVSTNNIIRITKTILEYHEEHYGN